MFEIKYTNSLDEIKKGFIGIHNKYAIKRSILFTFVYLISVVVGIDYIIKDNFAGYPLVAIGFGMLASTWVRPFIVRNRLMRTLQGLYEENYSACFYDDRIEIETEFINGAETEIVAVSKYGSEKVENPEITEKLDLPEPQKPEKTILKLNDEELYPNEDSTSFYLYVNRSLVYIFPKRCLNEEQINSIRNYLDEKILNK